MFLVIFSIKKKNKFFGVLGPPYSGIGATIRIGREMLCLPYAGFFGMVLTQWHSEFQKVKSVECILKILEHPNT